VTKKPLKWRKPKPRLPLEAALKLRSHPVSTRKGGKGYERKRVKELDRKSLEEEFFEENH
jgi:hypothetical protein